MHRVREVLTDIVLAVGVVWLFPFVLIALLLPVAAAIKVTTVLIEGL